MTPDSAHSAEQLSREMRYERSLTFTAALVESFANLVNDHAPVHFDPSFAQERGFNDRIVHGFFVASVFSGMLGEYLPGPNSVINALSLKIHRPVFVKDTITFTITVEQISSAVNAVVLALVATDDSGNRVLSGKATCSFPSTGSKIDV